MPDAVEAIFQKYNLLTSGECLSCEVCCRFPMATSPLAPFFSNEEAKHATAAGMPSESFSPGEYGQGQAVGLADYEPIYRCPGFAPKLNRCSLYADRPLDCRLYPFMLMYDAAGEHVILGIDSYCPVVLDDEAIEGFDACAAELAGLLEGDLFARVTASRGMVCAHNDHVRPLQELPNLSRALCSRGVVGLARVTPASFDALEPFFRAQGGSLSYHALAPIYVWSAIYDLHWKVSGERALIFALGEGDCFLIAPPMGAGDVAGPAAEALQIMRVLDPDAPSWRIQDVDDVMAQELAGAGWRIRDTHEEYVYDRGALASLEGNRYYQKRRLCRKFEDAEPDHVWRPFADEDLPAVVALYKAWLAERTATHSGELYSVQAEASLRALICGLREGGALGWVARVLRAGERTVGFTAACPLHDGQSFHVLFEVADLRVSGAAQFMYRALCLEMAGYEWVNAGGDSGLENLRRVKESYRPCQRLKARNLEIRNGE